ncbi:MAG: YhbY family RNA-binding protein [Methanomicrobiaceae archaeon]|nr:YhbY family RNA-binding protein [Methanomicrobiaceae archaeon]
MKATVWIGKQGCTGAIVDEIRMQLKTRPAVKIKWLRSCEIDPDDVARRAGARLFQVRGRTMILGARSPKP